MCLEAIAPLEVDVVVLSPDTEPPASLPSTEIFTDQQASKTIPPASANSVLEAPASNLNSHQQASETTSTTYYPEVPASTKSEATKPPASNTDSPLTSSY